MIEPESELEPGSGTESDASEDLEREDKPDTVFAAILKRVVGPAAAIVILYASLRALPSLIVNQAPPIDGDDLLLAFVISLVGFTVLAIWFDRRSAKKGKDE